MREYFNSSLRALTSLGVGCCARVLSLGPHTLTATETHTVCWQAALLGVLFARAAVPALQGKHQTGPVGR